MEEAKKSVEFKDLDADVIVQLLNEDDPFYKDGFRYTVRIGYPLSLGEMGSYSDNNVYKERPTMAELRQDVIDTLKTEINKLEEQGVLGSSRDENILAALKKVPLEEVKTYGEVTVGFGTKEQREVKITEYLRVHFKDLRFCNIGKLEDSDSYVLSVENIASTGRAPQSNIWLSKESMVALTASVILYMQMKGENINELLNDVIESKDIKLDFSDNLNLEKLKP